MVEARRWLAQRTARWRAAARRLGGVQPRAALGTLARAVGLSGWRAGAAVATSALAVLLLALVLGPTGPRLQPGTVNLPAVIGFYQNGWSSIFTSSFSSVKKHAQQINTVLAFWYSVDGSGTLHAHQPDPAVAQWVKSHHMQMGVLINNIAGTSGNSAGMLTDPTARAAAVRHIAAMVQAQGYQQVDIDFELLPPSARNGLSLFMHDLRQALPSSVVLSESVFPKLGVTQSINGAYDYVALAKSVNYLVLMLYDKHYDGGPAGPVSPYNWVVANVDWFLHTAHIAKSQLVVAAGVYGYDWPVGSTSAVEMPLTQIQAKIQALGIRPHTDPRSENPYFYYTSSSGTRHVVWYQNQTTVRQRWALVQKLGLRGMAIWALGEETPAVWDVLMHTSAG